MDMSHVLLQRQGAAEESLTHPHTESALCDGKEVAESNGSCRLIADSGVQDGTDRSAAANQVDPPPEFEPWYGADDSGGVNPADVALHLAEASLRYRKRWRPGFVWRLSFWVTSTLGSLLFLRPGVIKWSFRLPKIREKIQVATVSQLGDPPERNLAAGFLETFLREYSPWSVPLLFEDMLAARHERMRMARKRRAFEEWERREARREEDEGLTREWRWEGGEGQNQDLVLGLGLGLGLGQRERQKKRPLMWPDARRNEASSAGDVKGDGVGPAHEKFVNADQALGFKCAETGSQSEPRSVEIGVEEEDSCDVWLALAQSGVVT